MANFCHERGEPRQPVCGPWQGSAPRYGTWGWRCPQTSGRAGHPREVGHRRSGYGNDVVPGQAGGSPGRAGRGAGCGTQPPARGKRGMPSNSGEVATAAAAGRATTGWGPCPPPTTGSPRPLAPAGARRSPYLYIPLLAGRAGALHHAVQHGNHAGGRADETGVAGGSDRLLDLGEAEDAERGLRPPPAATEIGRAHV